MENLDITGWISRSEHFSHLVRRNESSIAIPTEIKTSKMSLRLRSDLSFEKASTWGYKWHLVGFVYHFLEIWI